jgi:hypothetical protein
MQCQLSITPASAEELRSPEFQKEMRSIERDLKERGFEPFAQTLIENSATTGGLWYLGQFVFDVVKSNALPAMIGVVSAYLATRAGRKVRLKIGEVEAEAHNVEEIKKLLKLADKHKHKER